MLNTNDLNPCWDGAFAALRSYIPAARKAEILDTEPTLVVHDFIQNGFHSGRCSRIEPAIWAMKNCSAWSDIVLQGDHATEEAMADAVAKNLESQRVLLLKVLEQPKSE